MNSRSLNIQSAQIPKNNKNILCILTRDYRLYDNWAIVESKKLADLHDSNMGIILIEPNKISDRIHTVVQAAYYNLLSETKAEGIPVFYSLDYMAEIKIEKIIDEFSIGFIVCDFNPLNWAKNLVSSIMRFKLNTIQVDAHNIVPCWILSDKQEYNVRFFRRKYQNLINIYLTDYPQLKYKNKTDYSELTESNNFDDGLKAIILNIIEDSKCKLRAIKTTPIKGYSQRNDLFEFTTSKLSTFLNRGIISAQRVVLNLIKNRDEWGEADYDSFFNELVYFREITDNFCHYNKNYDSFSGCPNWAKNTLKEHEADLRPAIYSLKQLNEAKTNDKLWNYIQEKLVKSGSINGYLRMYWAKQILTWTENGHKAFEYAITLNDRYELDGSDPSGFAGVAWSIGGLHDRPQIPRPIFGLVRKMCCSKFRRLFK